MSSSINVLVYQSNFENMTRGVGYSLQRIRSAEVSVGHSYNLIDVQTRRIVNVETASRYRFSVNEVGATPLFHANMYTHLQINQVTMSGKTIYKAITASN